MKKTFAFKSILAVFVLVFAVSSHSQNRTCGMSEYMEEMLKDPVLAKEYKANQKKFRAERTRRANGDFSKRGAETIIIPVAVHFPSGNEADRACLVALAQNQIDILNADYSATNADISNWATDGAFYPGLQPGSANISFCLATFNHPVGIDPELIEGEPAVTIGYNFGSGTFPEFDGNWAGYMNFLVKPINGLGYSPRGGSIAIGGSVVINISAFGSGDGCPGSSAVPGAPFNLGRTVTHELGHFYNLFHVWGDDNQVTCNTDDGFTDTPNTGQQTYNCPSAGSLDACTSPQKILSMNYMDYVDDACMYMFTPQQLADVEAYITSNIVPSIKPDVCAEQLSVAEFGIDQFSIFPNPNKGVFTIELTSLSNNDINIKVFDIRGRKIFKSTYTNNGYFNEEVRLDNVQSGMYLVTVSDGIKETTKKIIIE